MWTAVDRNRKKETSLIENKDGGLNDQRARKKIAGGRGLNAQRAKHGSIPTCTTYIIQLLPENNLI